MKYADMKWYYSTTISELERKMKCFSVLLDANRQCSLETIGQLILSKVDARTCGQGSAEWFLDRSFSLTSSTVDGIVNIIFSESTGSNGSAVNEISSDLALLKECCAPINYAAENLGNETGVAVCNETDDERSNGANSDDDNEPIEEVAGEDKDATAVAKSWLSTMTRPGMDCADEFISELTDNNAPLVLALLDLLGKKAVADIKKI